MDTNELEVVYTVSNPLEAEIIKNSLENEGIFATIGNENQAGGQGLIGLEIQILVPAIEAAKARKFIQSHEKHKAQGDVK